MPFKEVYICIYALFGISLIFGAEISSPIEYTLNGYGYTKIGVGVPAQGYTQQYFNALIDTINNGSNTINEWDTPVYTWVLTQDNIPDGSNIGGLNITDIKNGCFDPLPGNAYYYNYENTPITLTTVQSNITFGTYTTNTITYLGRSSQNIGYNWFLNESINAVLMMDNSQYSIIQLLKDYGVINEKKALINVAGNTISIGDYGYPYTTSTTPLNVENVTDLLNTWSFPITKFKTGDGIDFIGKDGNCTNCYAIIDCGNANIGYAQGTANFDYNTVISTVYKDTGVVEDLQFTTKDGSVFTIPGSTLGSNTQKRMEKRYSNSNDDTIIYLGLPFLTQVLVELNADYNQVSIMYAGEETVTYNHWVKVFIVIGSVVFAALLFFGIFFYYNKIPRAQPVGSSEHQVGEPLIGQPQMQNIMPNDQANVPINSQPQFQSNVQDNTYQQIDLNDDRKNYINQNQMLMPRNPYNNNNNNNNPKQEISSNNNNNNDVKSKKQDSGMKLGGSKKLTPNEIKAQRLAKLQANMNKQENE